MLLLWRLDALQQKGKGSTEKVTVTANPQTSKNYAPAAITEKALPLLQQPYTIYTACDGAFVRHKFYL